MAEYSKIAKGHVTTLANGGTPFINLPFQPQLVKWHNLTAATTPTEGYVTRGYWDVSMGQGYAIYDITTAGALFATKALATTSQGVYSFSAGLSLQFGDLVLIGAGAGAGIAKTDAATLTVTTSAAHGLKVGDWITFQNLYQTATTGMQQLAGIPFIVKTVASSVVFTVSWVGDASTLTALDNTHTGAAGFMKILYPQLYVPGIAFPWKISRSGSVVTVYTSAPTDFVVGQQIAFSIPSAYGGDELNELPNSALIPASPQSFYVTDVGTAVVAGTTYSDYFTFNYSGSLSTFNAGAIAFANFSGKSFPIVRAIGDVNSGGNPYAGGNLYPSPTYVTGHNASTGALLTASTINGPAILGSYINNTRQGFYLGTTVAPTAEQVIYWEAEYVDYAVN